MIQKTLRLTAVGIALCGFALALTGCTGAFVGNIFVVFVAVGIFFGTLGLGRNAGSTTTASGTDRPDRAAQNDRAS